MIVLIPLAAAGMGVASLVSYLRARRHGPGAAAAWRRGFAAGWRGEPPRR